MPQTEMVTRDKLDVPLQSDKQNIFEDPHNPSKKYYVQQYRIATRTVSGREEFKVALELSDTGGNLTVYLDEIQAEDNVSVTDNAKKMPIEEIKVALNYRSKKIIFQEVTFLEDGVKAILNLNKIEVTQLYQAITDSKYNTSLVVLQSIKIAAPGISSNPQFSITTSGETTLNKQLNKQNLSNLSDIDLLMLNRMRRIDSDSKLHTGHFHFDFDSGIECGDGCSGVRGKFANDSPYDHSLEAIFLSAIPNHRLGSVPKKSKYKLHGGFEISTTDPADRNSKLIKLSTSIKFDEISVAYLQSEIGALPNEIMRLKSRIATEPDNSFNPSERKWSLRLELQRLGNDVYIGGPGSSDFDHETEQRGPILCLRTTKGNYTKIEILSYKILDTEATCSFRWVTYNIPQHFVVKTIIKRQVLAPHPFTFSPDLDPYIFPHTPPEQVMIPHRVEWKNKGYIYFQKRTDPHEIYYLPDSFKLPRTPDSPHHLMMAVRFQQTGTEPEDMEVTLDYAAAPFTDEQRIKAANIELSRKLGEDLSSDQSLIFIPVQHVDSDNIIYKLGLPRAGAASGVFRERQDEHALVSMDGIRDQLSLALEDFQVIFDAMFSGDESILFLGKVEVDMGDDSTDSHTIPFTARIKDTVGDIFDYSESYDAATQEVGVKLTNAVESPIRINNLSAVLRRAGNQVDAEVRRVDMELPAELAPGEEITFTLAPSGPLAGEGACTISFDMHNVQVLPDKEAILNSIIDPTVPAEYTRKITIRTFEQVLTDNRAEAVVVELENGDTAVLESAALKTESIVRYPVVDLVLRRELPGGGCRYRLNVVQVSGQHPGPWQTSNSSTLFITSDMVAEALEAE